MTIEFINDGDQSEDMNKTISGKVQVIENANALKPCEMTNDVNGNGVADIGDEVTCDSESFYVYDNTGDNLKMLAKYNLYVGGYGVKYPNNTYAYFLYEEKTSNLQNVLMRADYGNYGGVRRGSIAFSRNSNAYSGSIVEEIVNNYSN